MLIEGFPVLQVQQISLHCVAEIGKRDYVIECLPLARLSEYLLLYLSMLLFYFA